MAGKLVRPVVHDPEATIPSFDLRGTVNKGKTGYWIYWFPIASEDSSSHHWFEIVCDPFPVLGQLRGYQVLDSSALDKRLAGGSLSIGLRGLDDLETALEVSRTCSLLLLKTLKSLRISDEAKG